MDMQTNVYVKCVYLRNCQSLPSFISPSGIQFYTILCPHQEQYVSCSCSISLPTLVIVRLSFILVVLLGVWSYIVRALISISFVDCCDVPVQIFCVFFIGLPSYGVVRDVQILYLSSQKTCAMRLFVHNLWLFHVVNCVSGRTFFILLKSILLFSLVHSF